MKHSGRKAVSKAKATKPQAQVEWIGKREFVVRGQLAELVRQVSWKLGQTPQEFVNDAMKAVIAKSKPLEFIEYFDDNEGIALDKDGAAFLVKGDGEPSAFPKTLTSCVPVSLKRAVEWLAAKHEQDFTGSTHEYERFFRLIAAKLPEGI